MSIERKLYQKFVNESVINENKISDSTIDKIKQELQDAIKSYFDNDEDILEYIYVDSRKDDDRTIVEVRAELGYNSMTKLADHLDKVVQKYDRYAYFEQETSGIMTAVFESAQKNESRNYKVIVTLGAADSMNNDSIEDVVEELLDKAGLTVISVNSTVIERNSDVKEKSEDSKVTTSEKEAISSLLKKSGLRSKEDLLRFSFGGDENKLKEAIDREKVYKRIEKQFKSPDKSGFRIKSYDDGSVYLQSNTDIDKFRLGSIELFTSTGDTMFINRGYGSGSMFGNLVERFLRKYPEVTLEHSKYNNNTFVKVKDTNDLQSVFNRLQYDLDAWFRDSIERSAG